MYRDRRRVLNFWGRLVNRNWGWMHLWWFRRTRLLRNRWRKLNLNLAVGGELGQVEEVPPLEVAREPEPEVGKVS